MSRWKTARLAGASALMAAGLLALPGSASATVNASVDAAGKLTVTSDAADPITVTSVAGKVQVNSAAVTGDPNSAAITAIEVNGGPGENNINLGAVTGADFTALTTISVYGGEGNDTINGTQLADTLNGGGGNDRVIGDDNPLNTRDQSYGEAGDDTMVWNPGDDDDVNEGGEGNDTVEVNGGNGPEQFEAKPSATAGRVVFDRTGPTPPGPFNIDIGTSERLDLNANGGDDTYSTAVGALAIALDIDGGEGNDVLDGGDGADLIRGGGGNDRIIGDDNPAGTRDQSLGEAGDDTMVWNPGDDDDVNEGGEGNDTAEVNGGGLEQFEVKPSATPGRVAFDRVQPDPTFGAPFNVDISDDTERLDLNAGGGVDIVNAAAGLDALAFALDIDGGDDNDVLDGGDGADLIKGGNGNDRITGDDNPLNTRDQSLGEAGDDTMVWNAGDDDDVNEGGEGNDTVEVNGGGKERFEVKPSATPGRVAFDRVQPDPTFLAPFSIDIGTSEQFVLNAGDGDDRIVGAKGLAALIKSTLNGGDGNDRITGTDGKDLLTGGKGLDLINSRDRAGDEVQCNGGFDLALVDRRDTVRGCEIVLGGFLRVKHNAKSASVAGDAAVLDLRCLATGSCKGKVQLIYGGKSIGSKSYKIKGKKSKTVRVKLGNRGQRLLAKAPSRGLAVKLRIDAKDSAGNGWRTTDSIRLKG